MKIWIDVLTPKQLLFSESIIEKLSKKHQFLCTSRRYEEVSKLAKIRNFDLIYVGKHGGIEKRSKLEASIYRMKKLTPLVSKFSPDLTISFCSPEAARISFGLGIKHVAFCDSPHAVAVMKLTLPLIQKLLIPWIIPKKEFSKFGIHQKKIIQYKAIDAFVTIKRKVIQNNSPLKKLNKKNILIRLEEEEASYISKSNTIIPIIKKITQKFHQDNVIILARYTNQIKKLQKIFGHKVTFLKMSFDGKRLFENCDVFVGSGGTMTAESALLGIPTISYNAVPNKIEEYLVKNNFVKRETDPEKIVYLLERNFKYTNKKNQNKCRKFLDSMEDPIQQLIQVIKE